MPQQTRNVTPGPQDRTVRDSQGQILPVPPDWSLLPPGDATLTRRVKAAGPTWTVQQKKGRRTFSLGLWAPAAHIESSRAALEAERGTEQYAKKKASAIARREKKQAEYVDEFRVAILAFLRFAPEHDDLAEQMSKAITEHATPVGSGTVARTERIPIAKRAASAVIAWLRHQTTAYDTMKVPRIKGKRREIRRQLAEESRALLDRYRQGEPIPKAECLLWKALETGSNQQSPQTCE